MPTDPGTLTASPERSKRVWGKPFTKGDPRVWRGGRTKRAMAVRELIRKELDRKIETSQGKMPAAVAIVRKAVIEAVKGDHKWATFLWDYAYGKPVQPLANDPENPLLSSATLAAVTARLNGSVAAPAERTGAETGGTELTG